MKTKPSCGQKKIKPTTVGSLRTLGRFGSLSFCNSMTLTPLYGQWADRGAPLCGQLADFGTLLLLFLLQLDDHKLGLLLFLLEKDDHVELGLDV